MSVSSDSDVVLCFPSLDSLAPLDLLAVNGACVFLVVHSGLFLNSRKASAMQVAFTFSSKEGQYMSQQHRRLSVVRRSGRSASWRNDGAWLSRWTTKVPC